MAYDVDQLLEKTDAELDALAGRGINPDDIFGQVDQATQLSSRTARRLLSNIR